MKLIERKQLLQFLMGLNESYQLVRSNILVLNPLPSVSQASSMVLQEEQQRELRSFNSQQSKMVEFSAFLSQQRHHTSYGRLVSSSYLPQAAHHDSQPSTKYHNVPTTRKPNVQCNYYRKLDHTIDKCYKLQRLREQTEKGKRLAASVQHISTVPPFNDVGSVNPTEQREPVGHYTLALDQYEQPLALLSKHNIQISLNVEATYSAYLAGKSCSTKIKLDSR